MEKRVAGKSEKKSAKGEESCRNILKKMSMGAKGEERLRKILKENYGRCKGRRELPEVVKGREWEVQREKRVAGSS
jgi:hypothetical protein